VSGHNIQAILIIERGGIPLFFMKLDPKAQDLDPMLVSGFFTAIQSFSREVIERDSSMFQVDYGARLFTIMTGKTTNLVAVSMGEWIDDVTSVLHSLHEEFERVWLKGMKRRQKDTLKIDSAFPEFREGIVKNLSFRPISDSWVPFLPARGDEDAREDDGVLGPYIDGVRTVDEIVFNSGIGREAVIDEITRLWAVGRIRFCSMLGKEDIVVSTSKMDRLLQSSSPARAEFGRKNPDLLSILPRLSALADGRRTIGAVVQGLSDSASERQVLQALDVLLESGAVVTLTPEKRRILLVKEAFELAVRVCEVAYSPHEALLYLNAALDRAEVPELAGVVKVSGSQWELVYDSRLYEGLDPKRLMELYAEWMKLLAKFVSSLEKSRILKYAEALTDAYSAYLLGRYSSDDLAGFEEFSFWLEMNCASAGGRQ
jgi:hypothetical protein